MKLKDIFENAAAGATATCGGDVAGSRGALFTRHPLLKRKRNIGRVKVIRYNTENNWNLR